MQNATEKDIKDTALEWLVLLQAPELSDAQRQEFFDWLNSNPEHQKAYIRAEELWFKGGALSQVGKTASVKTETKRKRGGFSTWFMPGIQVAFTCSVLVVCYVFFFKSAPKVEVYQTQLGEQRTITLADSSVLTLNTQSSIEVSLEHKQGRHITLLGGEVFFDVARDETKPFIVSTRRGDIVVLGTQFSVFNQNDQTEVTVLEGKVGVSPKEKGASKTLIELTANQQAVMSDSAETQVSEVDSSRSLAWRTGRLQFQGIPLKQVLSELNRYYPERIKLGDAALANQQVVAIFSLDNDFGINLQYLEQSLNLKAKPSLDGATFTLYAKDD